MDIFGVLCIALGVIAGITVVAFIVTAVLDWKS